MTSRKQYTPSSYAATKNEVGVFTTPGYSENIKPLWKFKNAEEARKSAEAIWKCFEGYRDRNDFVGPYTVVYEAKEPSITRSMDVCRKFIQMGRTRSLRYALRPGGKKYDPATGKEQKRTGKVYDQGKLDGANIYENYLDECWSDKVYKKAWDDWKEGKETEYVKVPGVDETDSPERKGAKRKGKRRFEEQDTNDTPRKIRVRSKR